MLGAIIGDIVGSIYEFDNIKTKDFELFDRECFFTDDTVSLHPAGSASGCRGTVEEISDGNLRGGRLSGRYLCGLFSGSRRKGDLTGELCAF